jgi:hypothetical protein
VRREPEGKAVTFLASRRWRIFLIAWIVYSVHFATNVVREHYPAFSISQHGTFNVDEYVGFHSDIFVGPTGHAVIGNQVLVPALAAIPLFIFDPVLDALERYSKAKLAREGVSNAEYRIDKPMRVNFFRIVKERGLDLRFGAATFITTACFMAPLTALFLVFFYGVLRRRGLDANHATGLTLVMGLGTPLFYRTSSLGHNLFVMFAMFGAFVVLWTRPDERMSTRRRLLAGLLGGLTLATDYVGMMLLPLLYGYFVLPRARAASWGVAIKESMALVVGALPAVAFLLYSQWAMYGNPFYPGQHWMPDQNIYVREGVRGFTLPSLDLFAANLFHPAYGMYTWAPLLLLALVPAWRYGQDTLVLPRRERRFVAIVWIVLLLFASSNQYSRLQFNSGFRYLVPLVPFLVLALADHWVRLGRRVQWFVAGAVVVHAWVLTVYREPIVQSWRMLFAEGPQLPWYRVLSLTADPNNPWLGTWWVPSVVLAITIGLGMGIWRYGARLELRHGIE